MGNREKRIRMEAVNMYLAFQRVSHGNERCKCFRSVIKDDPMLTLKILESKLKFFPGVWRIHKTVNKRDTEKARKWLLHRLIEHPEMASTIDSEFRTALLQTGNAWGENKWMFDVDTQDPEKLKEIIDKIPSEKIIEGIKSPKGWHIITSGFDSREVCKLKDVTLIRDGYYFIKEIIV